MNTAASRKRDGRYWRNLSLFGLACSFVGYLFVQFVGVPVFAAYGYSHPQRLAVCCYTPAALGLSYEDVSFETSDGLTLRGWYLPSRNRAGVILLHSLASNRMGALEGAVILARHGYGVLLPDLRAHGESDGEVFPYGGPEAEDLLAAVKYLQTRADLDAGRIGAMGWSLGGQVSILGAARTTEIKAVVADGPWATALEDWPPPHTIGDWLNLPMDLVFYLAMPWYTGVRRPGTVREAVALISPRPILLISAGFERERRRMEYLLDAAQEPKSLWIIPEANHIEGLSKRPVEYEEKVVGFFDEALLGSSP